MSNKTPIELFQVREPRHNKYRIRTFRNGDSGWYCELLQYDSEWLMPGHLCGRMKPIKYVVVGIHPMSQMMSIYYGGRDKVRAQLIAGKEGYNGAWLIEVEQLPTPPNKHDYPQYQVRGNPGRPDAVPVADQAAEHDAGRHEVQS